MVGGVADQPPCNQIQGQEGNHAVVQLWYLPVELTSFSFTLTKWPFATSPREARQWTITKLLVTWHPCAGPFSEPRTNKSVLIILPAYCIDTGRRIFFFFTTSYPYQGSIINFGGAPAVFKIFFLFKNILK